MPCHLISDVHEWMNEILTVPGCSLVNPQPRERPIGRERSKTLLNLTLVIRNCESATEEKSKWETSVTMQHHYSHRNSLLTSKENECTIKTCQRAARPVTSRRWSDETACLRRDRHSRNRSLTGAVHLSKNNAGIPS